MRVGDLVRDKHYDNIGIVTEIGPEPTYTDHADGVCKVQWFEPHEVTLEFVDRMEVISEGK
jgi:hypothetical protein